LFLVDKTKRCRIATKASIEAVIKAFVSIEEQFEQDPTLFIPAKEFRQGLNELRKSWLARFRAIPDLSPLPASLHHKAHDNVLTIPATVDGQSRTGHLFAYLSSRIGFGTPHQSSNHWICLFAVEIIAVQGVYISRLDFTPLYREHNPTGGRLHFAPTFVGEALSEDLVQQSVLPAETQDDLISLPFYKPSALELGIEVGISVWLNARLAEISRSTPELALGSSKDSKRRKALLVAARSLWATDKAFYAASTPHVRKPERIAKFDEAFYIGVVVKRAEAERRDQWHQNATFSSVDKNIFTTPHRREPDFVSNGAVTFVHPPLPSAPHPDDSPKPPLPPTPSQVAEACETVKEYLLEQERKHKQATKPVKRTNRSNSVKRRSQSSPPKGSGKNQQIQPPKRS
jgi:hypothetical protein